MKEQSGYSFDIDVIRKLPPYFGETIQDKVKFLSKLLTDLKEVGIEIDSSKQIPLKSV